MLKPEDLSDGIGLVDEKLLHAAEEERQRLEKLRRRRRKRMIQGAGMAAVLALCTAVGIHSGIWKLDSGKNSSFSIDAAEDLSGEPAEVKQQSGNALVGNGSDTAGGQMTGDAITEVTHADANAEPPKLIAAAVYPDRVKYPDSVSYYASAASGSGQEAAADSSGDGMTGAEEAAQENEEDTVTVTIGDVETAKESLTSGGSAFEAEMMSYRERMENWWQEKTDRKEASEKLGNELSDCTEKLISQLFIHADGENRAFSPVNLYLGLGMLAEITDGSSREQVLSLLGMSDMEQLRETADALWQSTWQDDGLVTTRLASSLWLDQNLQYRRKAMEQLAEVYRASSYQGTMGSAAYNDLFHSWLNEQTGNLLQEQAENLELDSDTVLCMAATIYYKASWKEKFREEENTRELFHGAKTEEEAVFMNGMEYRSYVKGDHYQAAVQEIQGDGSLLLILPDEGTDLDTLLQEAEVRKLMTGADDSMQSVPVDLSLPKFDICSDLDMIEDLEALGVTDVFTPGTADFSPIIEDPEKSMALSLFQHASRITADEKGMEAAAYTVMELKEAAEEVIETDIVKLKLDRPFLMVIRDDNGLPLFMGMVNQVK